MAPASRIRPYKDFLTPALHRRFATATVILFGLCYAEALVIGEWNSCRFLNAYSLIVANKSFSLVVMVAIWTSRHTNRASFHPGIYDICSQSCSATCGHTDILFGVGHIPKIRAEI